MAEDKYDFYMGELPKAPKKRCASLRVTENGSLHIEIEGFAVMAITAHGQLIRFEGGAERVGLPHDHEGRIKRSEFDGQ